MNQVNYYLKENILFGGHLFEGEYLNDIINGKGKEYDYHGNLSFEGEFFDGYGNRKGKEYKSGELIFEGEYLNGKKQNGIEYIKGKKIFEGDYLNEKKWNGKVYDKNGNLFGELKNGNGKILEYYEDGELKYEGEYSNGERNGKGKEYSKSGKLLFEGEYLNGEIYNGIKKEYNIYTGDNVGEIEYKNGEICRQDMVGSIFAFNKLEKGKSLFG